MKKFMLFCITFIMLLPATVQAKVGDVIGTAYHTDIVAYINHYAIPSYAVNGTSCIVAEDLKNFGFHVTWDNATRTLSITRNRYANVTGMNFSKTGAPSDKFADLLETDIAVYASGVKLTSYAINGYTMIPLEELTMFGSCAWVESERAVKLWVEDLHMRSQKQYVPAYGETVQSTSTSTSAAQSHYYYGTTVPDYSYVTGVALKDVYYGDNGTVYQYPDTHYGQYSECVDYMGHLRDIGWREYSSEEDRQKISWYYVKGNEMVGITYHAKYDEVWIIPR